MRNQLKCLLFFFSISPLFTACKQNSVTGSGNVGSESRTVNGAFRSIEISAPVKAIIHVEEGATPSVSLNGYQNLLKHITIEVKDSVLYIKLPEDIRIESDKQVTAQISLPMLKELDLNGSADAEIRGVLKADELDIEVAGSSDIVVDNLIVDDFSLSIAGSGDFTAKAGTVRDATYEITGSGDINAYPLQADSADVTISGAGDMEISVAKKLSVEINGAGNVSYKGEPEVSSEINGAGTLNKVK